MDDMGTPGSAEPIDDQLNLGWAEDPSGIGPATEPSYATDGGDEWVPVGPGDGVRGENVVVDLGPVGAPGPQLVFDPSGHASVLQDGQAAPSSDPVPAEPEPQRVDSESTPTAEHLAITLSDGTVIDAGVPTLDLFGDDDVPDTVETEEGGATMDVMNTDGKPGADQVLVTEDGVTTMFVERDPQTGEWSPVAETQPGDPDSGHGRGDTIEVPARYQVAIDTSADISVQALTHMNATMAEAAAGLWSSAYPGTPWPVDDETGEPYPPRILLGVIANDEDVASDMKSTALQMVETFDRTTTSIVKQP
ncbi:MAG: hypothetical protein WKF57_19110 [Nakamurella sp.]